MHGVKNADFSVRAIAPLVETVFQLVFVSSQLDV